MIQTMFLGRVDYERLERKGRLPDLVEQTVAAVRDGLKANPQHAAALAAAGFAGMGEAAPLRERRLPGYWIGERRSRARRSRAGALARIGEAARPLGQGAAKRSCGSPTTPRFGKRAIPPISAVPSPSRRRRLS